MKKINEAALQPIDGVRGKLLVKEKPKTKHWTWQAVMETAKKIVNLHDAWLGALELEVDQSKAKETRLAIATRNTGATTIAIDPPEALANQVQLVANMQKVNRHEVIAWCVDRGCDLVTPDGLIGAFPNRMPSLSLVGVLALDLGMKQIEHFQPAARDSNGNAVGRRSIGPWATRQKPPNKPKEV